MDKLNTINIRSVSVCVITTNLRKFIWIRLIIIKYHFNSLTFISKSNKLFQSLRNMKKIISKFHNNYKLFNYFFHLNGRNTIPVSCGNLS